MEKTAFEYVR